MNAKDRKRCERLLDDLMWFVTESGVEMDGQMRDNVSEIRDALWEVVEPAGE